MMNRVPSWSRRDWIGMGLVATAAIIVFAGSFRHLFVYDDVHILITRDTLHSISGWKEIITSAWWSGPWASGYLYRPVSQLSLAFDWTVSNGNPYYFHVVNVLLHALTTVLVYALARRWLSLAGATVAGLIFAVHPVHVEAVAYVVGRTEVLATLFSLCAVMTYLWDGELARRGDSGWRRIVSSFGTLALLGLALGSKESAFAAPGLLLIGDWMSARHDDQDFVTYFRSHGVLWVSTVIFTAEWLMLRTVLLGDVAGDMPAPGLAGEGMLGRILVMAPIILHYARLFFFPLHLSADYSVDFIRAIPQPTVWGGVGLIVLSLCIYVGWKMRTRAPVVTFSLAWIGGALFIVSNILVPTGVLLAERSMYLPSVGVAVLLGWAVHALRPTSRWITLSAFAVVIGLGAVRTVIRVPDWKNEDAVYLGIIRDAPGSFRSMWLGAMYWYGAERPEEGERLLRTALVTYPLWPNVWQSFGRQLRMQERYAESAQAFAAAFRIDTGRVYDAASAITDFIRSGQPDSARVLAERARRISAYEPNLLLALGEIAMHEGDALRAMTLYRRAAWQEPNAPRFWFHAATAAAAAGYCRELSRSVRRLGELAPAYPGLDTLVFQRDSLECVLGQ